MQASYLCTEDTQTYRGASTVADLSREQIGIRVILRLHQLFRSIPREVYFSRIHVQSCVH